MKRQFQLPSFPPRKARESPRLINFVLTLFIHFCPFNVSIPQGSPYQRRDFYNLLVRTAIVRGSISRLARVLRERYPSLPAGETVLRWLRRLVLKKVVKYQDRQFRRFVDHLPPAFQQVRKSGMILALDFHTDPTYTKKFSPYIGKLQRKKGTNRNFMYFTLLWVNAPTPITLAVRLIKRPYQVYPVTRELLAPWLHQENVDYVLADGAFYVFSLLQ